MCICRVYRFSEFRCQLPLDVLQAAEIQVERDQEQAQAGRARSPLRQLACIIGVWTSTHLAVLTAPLHYRGLQAQ